MDRAVELANRLIELGYVEKAQIVAEGNGVRTWLVKTPATPPECCLSNRRTLCRGDDELIVLLDRIKACREGEEFDN